MKNDIYFFSWFMVPATNPKIHGCINNGRGITVDRSFDVLHIFVQISYLVDFGKRCFTRTPSPLDPIDWPAMPRVVREKVVDFLDIKTRYALRRCSKSDQALVERSLKIIEADEAATVLRSILKRVLTKNLVIECHKIHNLRRFLEAWAPEEHNVKIRTIKLTWNCQMESARELRRVLALVQNDLVTEVLVNDGFLINLDWLMRSKFWNLLKAVYPHQDVFIDVQKHCSLKVVEIYFVGVDDDGSCYKKEVLRTEDPSAFYEDDVDSIHLPRQTFTFSEITERLKRLEVGLQWDEEEKSSWLGQKNQF
ncbi:Protein CBG11947 [Caenorhabditis briggsae]|uniref:Protein CBG11947 n=1 Tax=Caenorhabditis briggsae TaxID=6238 RepID=A8XEN2_CAEBR|nr:Protein CBG11947 [Caenorhabditis briggsae]CAP31000.1 Protein CBG11947 [Caenorhabditis briggsae]